MLRPLMLLILTASVAQAQLPSLRRKVKDAGRQAVTGQQDPNRPPPKFDNTILELNPGVVARLIKGLEARSTARGRGGQTAGQLRHRSSAAAEEARSLNDQHSDDRANWVSATNEAENCLSDELGNMEQRRSQAMQQKMMSLASVPTPERTKFMQDYAAAGAELQQAAAANDSVALARAEAKLNRLLGVDAHADSARARVKCHAPPVPAWMRRADSLAAISDTLVVQARVAEDSARVLAAGAAGMSQSQFAMAAERAEGFVRLQDCATVGSGYVFTHTEADALRARLVDLKKYFG